ncbi:MAG TPA: DsbA family protein [Acidimicrobiales bacterium]|nr:DsbA family protein [Acidimicrobiales bacterium]
MIEVFADIWCPFAYVGLQIVRARRDEFAPDVPVRVRAWPLELVNGAPMDVGKTTRNVAALREQLDVGLFEGFDPARFPTTTLPALAAAAAATRAGHGEAANFRVRAALWEEGRDIGDEAEAAALAAEFGVEITDADRQSVLDDWHEGQQRGVQGSPHFFCGANNVFCPSLALARDDDGVLHVAPDPSRLEAFLSSCWS